MEFCSSNDPSLKATCRFFVLGVVEGATAADGTTMRGKQFIEGTKTLICLPDGVTTATMVEGYQTMVRGVAQAYPGDLDLPAVSTVMAAMAQRYRRGVGTIKVIGSVKAYKPGLLVDYDDVRALLGVMTDERDTSKGIITTTSDFPPNIMKDPFIAPFVPYRLELMNGKALQEWLRKLASR